MSMFYKIFTFLNLTHYRQSSFLKEISLHSSNISCEKVFFLKKIVPDQSCSLLKISESFYIKIFKDHFLYIDILYIFETLYY